MSRAGLLLTVSATLLATVFSGCGDGKGAIDIATAKPGELTLSQMRDLPAAKRLVYQMDFYAREHLASTEYKTLEALEWLKADNHVGGDLSKADLQKTAEDFYAADAKEVYVTWIQVLTREDFTRQYIRIQFE